MDPTFHIDVGESPPPNLDINPYGYWRLLHDGPQKRRKVYLELNLQTLDDVQQELRLFEVDLSELKCLLKGPSRVQCFVTATAHSLLAFLTGSAKVRRARVDLREYAMITPPP